MGIVDPTTRNCGICKDKATHFLKGYAICDDCDPNVDHNEDMR